jgi:hypothetical protein
MNQQVLFDQISVILDEGLDSARMQIVLSTIRSIPGVHSVTALSRNPATPTSSIYEDDHHEDAPTSSRTRSQ